MKDASQKNVVMMSHFERSRAVPDAPGARLLNDCRDLAASRLAQALSVMLDKAVDDLFNLSEQATHFEVRNLYIEAMTIARDQRSVIETGFKRQFLQGFSKEARQGKKFQHESSFNLDELSLVEPDDLEESLASTNITNSIYGDCAEELFGVDKRMGALLHDPDLVNTNNPLGPEVIGKAFMDAMKGLDCPVKVKLLFVNLFNKHMPHQVKDIYQDINQHLVEKGVLPKIRVGAKKRAASAEASPPGQADAAAEISLPAGDSGLFAALQQLLTRGDHAGQGAGGAMPQGGPAAQNLSVVSALTKLQHGQLEGLVGNGSSLDAAALAGGYANVLRDIKTTAVAGTMGQMDAMTLDIVAMLFDYILDDRRIPDAMKALVGRLQIPVLKVAMLDKTFFSQKSHPARKLLDKLAEISIGWDETEGHQSGLYKKVDDLIQRILNEFDDKVGIFAEVLEELEQYLAEERKRVNELTGLSAQVVHRREQAEIAKIMAHDEIRRRIHSPQLPEVIRSFLVGCWETVLATAYVKAGEEGDAWGRAIESMDELLWSVAPKRVPDERKKLVRLLPSLLKRLQDGMVLANFPEAERDQFFARLVKCHADAIKSGLGTLPQEGETQAEFVAQEFDAEDSAEIAQQSVEPGNFMEVPLPLEAVAPDPAFVQALSDDTEPELEMAWQTFTIGDAQKDELELYADDYDAMVKRLKRGTWIEFDQENGVTTRVKLAWVSPLKGLYLFTNRLGERAVSITPAGLAEKLRNGHAQIIDDMSLIDSAVNNLMERLKKSASLTE